MESKKLVWDPAKYAQFGDYRQRPFFDLTSRVQAAQPAKVVDLGCGPGPLTAELARHWPNAQVLGVDSSPEMISQATALKDKPANLNFVQADISHWMPDPDTDVIVSNAALQWVPGHQELMRGWLDALKPGAWLAVQVPGNFRSPSHTLMRQLAESERWKQQLDGVLRHDDAVWEPAQYQELLLGAGCLTDVWETTYNQMLTGERPVLQWVQGTALRPVMAALTGSDATEFETDYAARLDAAYPATVHGTVFPFRRLFMVAQKVGRQ